MGTPPQESSIPWRITRKPLAAGVHHTGLLQDGVHLGGVLQGELPSAMAASSTASGSLGFGGRVGGLGRRQAGDGEDGALGGLHHRLVGGGHAEVQGDGQIAAVDAVLVLDRLGKAAEEQGQNDAGLPRPAAGRRRWWRRPRPRCGAASAQLRRGGAEGQAHVGAGVPVGHGEDVQFVDLLLLQIEGRPPRESWPGQTTLRQCSLSYRLFLPFDGRGPFQPMTMESMHIHAAHLGPWCG